MRPTGPGLVATTGTAIDNVARRLTLAVGHLVHVLPESVTRGVWAFGPNGLAQRPDKAEQYQTQGYQEQLHDGLLVLLVIPIYLLACHFRQ